MSIIKPSTCVDENCKGSDTCSMCINRNIVAKMGYELIQTVENVPASPEQTEAVTKVSEFVDFCSKLMN